MKHSRSSLFLMEMIIAILFFSLASAVCIQLFARSHLLSTRTVNQNHAVIWAQNLAEGYLSGEGDLDAVSALFPDGIRSDADTLYLPLDADWQPATEASSSYYALLTNTPDTGSGISEAKITIGSTEDNDAPIYSLTIRHHTAERRGDYE